MHDYITAGLTTIAVLLFGAIAGLVLIHYSWIRKDDHLRLNFDEELNMLKQRGDLDKQRLEREHDFYVKRLSADLNHHRQLHEMSKAGSN